MPCLRTVFLRASLPALFASLPALAAGQGLFGIGYAPDAQGHTLDDYAFPATRNLIFAAYFLPSEPSEGWGMTFSWTVSNISAKTMDRPVEISDLQYNYSIFSGGLAYRLTPHIFFTGGLGYSFENAERSINAQGDLQYETYETKEKTGRINLFGGMGWITSDKRCPVGAAVQYDSAPRAVSYQLLLGCSFA